MPSSSHAEWNCTLVKKCQKLWKHGTQLSTYGEQESHMNSPPPPPIPWTSNTWPCFANLNKRACKAVDMIHENIFYRKDKENWTYARITEEIKEETSFERILLPKLRQKIQASTPRSHSLYSGQAVHHQLDFPEKGEQIMDLSIKKMWCKTMEKEVNLAFEVFQCN